MIKRRFFKQEHGDNSADDVSSSSDSSSDSEDEIEAEEEEDRFDDKVDDFGVVGPQNELHSGSGYEREDSSVNEVLEDEDPSGWSNDEDGEISEPVRERSKVNLLGTGVEVIKDDIARTKDAAIDMDDPIQVDISNYILKQKSVFRCKLCPRIVCLSEDTLRTHLKSKRHVRSKKLFGEGRLKLMLNSDGEAEVEEDQETHAERHARTVALAQEVQASKKKDSGRQRQNRRRKKRQQRQCDKRKTEHSKEKTMKKKRKTEN